MLSDLNIIERPKLRVFLRGITDGRLTTDSGRIASVTLQYRVSYILFNSFIYLLLRRYTLDTIQILETPLIFVGNWMRHYFI